MQPVAQPELFARQRRLLQWTFLLILSIIFVTALEFARLPAALLIGPMLAAIIAGTNGATIRPPRIAVYRARRPSSAASSLHRSGRRSSPRSTRNGRCSSASSGDADGKQPARLPDQPLEGAARHHGGVGFDTRRGERHGADGRRVRRRCAAGRLHAVSARHLRVVCRRPDRPAVGRHIGRQPAPIVWFPPIDWPAFAATLAIAAGGAAAGRLLRFPAGTFLGPMILGTALHLGGYVELQLPPWLLAVSYAVIGWSIGLNFTRTILRHAARALPQIVASIVALIAFCAALGFAMSRALGIDPLTAYLATSPGGMDSSPSSRPRRDRVDISFVMALQTARFLIVLVAGPPLARLLARRRGRLKPHASPRPYTLLPLCARKALRPAASGRAVTADGLGMAAS